MVKAPLFAAFVVALAFTPVQAQDNKDWCTDAHMKVMDGKVAAMTDATKKKSAQTHLDASKTAMKAGDTKGCVDHMKEAHKGMAWRSRSKIIAGALPRCASCRRASRARNSFGPAPPRALGR